MRILFQPKTLIPPGSAACIEASVAEGFLAHSFGVRPEHDVHFSVNSLRRQTADQRLEADHEAKDNDGAHPILARFLETIASDHEGNKRQTLEVKLRSRGPDGRVGDIHDTVHIPVPLESGGAAKLAERLNDAAKRATEKYPPGMHSFALYAIRSGEDGDPFTRRSFNVWTHAVDAPMVDPTTYPTALLPEDRNNSWPAPALCWDRGGYAFNQPVQLFPGDRLFLTVTNHDTEPRNFISELRSVEEMAHISTFVRLKYASGEWNPTGLKMPASVGRYMMIGIKLYEQVEPGVYQEREVPYNCPTHVMREVFPQNWDEHPNPPMVISP